MDIKSFWTEHKNFEIFSFHREVGVCRGQEPTCTQTQGSSPLLPWSLSWEGSLPARTAVYTGQRNVGKAERVQGLTVVKKGANRDCSSVFSEAAIIPAVSQEYWGT